MNGNPGQAAPLAPVVTTYEPEVWRDERDQQTRAWLILRRDELLADLARVEAALKAQPIAGNRHARRAAEKRAELERRKTARVSAAAREAAQADVAVRIRGLAPAVEDIIDLAG